MVNPHVVFWVTVGEGDNNEYWLIEAPDRDSLVHDGWQQPSEGEGIVFEDHCYASAPFTTGACCRIIASTFK